MNHAYIFLNKSSCRIDIMAGYRSAKSPVLPVTPSKMKTRGLPISQKTENKAHLKTSTHTRREVCQTVSIDLPLLSLSLVGLATTLLGASSLTQRIRALLKQLEVFASRVGARGVLGHVRVGIIIHHGQFCLNSLGAGDEATDSEVENPNWGANNGRVLESGLEEFLRLIGKLSQHIHVRIKGMEMVTYVEKEFIHVAFLVLFFQENAASGINDKNLTVLSDDSLALASRGSRSLTR